MSAIQTCNHLFKDNNSTSYIIFDNVRIREFSTDQK